MRHDDPRLIPLDDIDRRIVNRLQDGFPLVSRPYAAAAAELGLNEGELLERIDTLLDRGILTRFGPLFQIERAGGCFVLCACHAPAGRLDAVADAINAFPEVAHNYLREHHLNLWFVVAIEHADMLDDTLARISAAAGVPVLPFPKQREFLVHLRLEA